MTKTVSIIYEILLLNFQKFFHVHIHKNNFQYLVKPQIMKNYRQKLKPQREFYVFVRMYVILGQRLEMISMLRMT